MKLGRQALVLACMSVYLDELNQMTQSLKLLMLIMLTTK